MAQASGLKHGAVQDKLFLPGCASSTARRAGFFGRMLTLRLEFGYWVFEGDLQPIQRRQNYAAKTAAAILDLMCHWRYVLDNLFGEVQSVSCSARPIEHWDEDGKPPATADDAYATVQTKATARPIVAQLNMSWATRARRPRHLPRRRHRRLGGRGLATAASSRACRPGRLEPRRQAAGNCVEQWQDVPDTTSTTTHQDQLGTLHPPCRRRRAVQWTLGEGAKGVQLVEAALESWKERRWIDVAPLAL